MDPELQDFVTKLVNTSAAKHVAIVVMEPTTGRVLAVAGKSPTIPNLWAHNGFPAASLFKVITATAAIETSAINPESLVRFRGGDHTLGRENYSPNPRLDTRVMSVGEAMGKSCNPVFARLTLNFLNSSILRRYVNQFGFNRDLECDVPVSRSIAQIPDDTYEFSRTGAGFGDVTLSPVHAAAMMSGIANDGKLPRPTFIDRLVSPTGVVQYRSSPTTVENIMSKTSSRTLLRMMEYTITQGTSRKEFMRKNVPVLDINAAGKTGTLLGDNPKGLNNWFIGTAPVERPRIAVAAIVTDDKGLRTKASHLGRVVMEQYFNH